MYTTALLLTAVGGLNWGLIGFFDFNLVSAIFGADTLVTNLIYMLVGLSALYLVAAHFWQVGRAQNPERTYRTHSHTPQHSTHTY